MIKLSSGNGVGVLCVSLSFAHSSFFPSFLPFYLFPFPSPSLPPPSILFSLPAFCPLCFRPPFFPPSLLSFLPPFPLPSSLLPCLLPPSLPPFFLLFFFFPPSLLPFLLSSLSSTLPLPCSLPPSFLISSLSPSADVLFPETSSSSCRQSQSLFARFIKS